MNKWLGTSVKPYEVASKCFPCELYDKGSNNTISASVRGGAPGATYFASLRYINSDGPYNENATLNGAPVGYSDPTKPGSNDMRDQFMVSATLNIVPTDRLRLRVSTNYTYTDHNTIQNNNNSPSNNSSRLYSKYNNNLVQTNENSGLFNGGIRNNKQQMDEQQRMKQYYNEYKQVRKIECYVLLSSRLSNFK